MNDKEKLMFTRRRMPEKDSLDKFTLREKAYFKKRRNAKAIAPTPTRAIYFS